MIEKTPQPSPRPRRRGHWPAGKRRNAHPTIDWDRLREVITTLLTRCRRYRVRSQLALADEIGVNKATVGRWLAGTHWPTRDRQRELLDWSIRQVCDLIQDPETVGDVSQSLVSHAFGAIDEEIAGWIDGSNPDVPPTAMPWVERRRQTSANRK